MNPTLKVNRAQHGSSDLLSHRWAVPRVHRLARFLDPDDLDEPDDRIAPIGEKPERVMVQHGPAAIPHW